MIHLRAIRTIAGEYPATIPNLKGYARWIVFTGGGEYKTPEYFQNQVERLVRSVYDTNISSEFLDLMASLIGGQIRQAFAQAWTDEGIEGQQEPDYLLTAAETLILQQYEFVDQLYKDIVSARELGQPIEPLLARASLWSNRWTEAYNEGVRQITVQNGGKLIWELGQTEQHCDSCSRLAGVVAYAMEWEELGVKPQSAPNDMLTCGGWRCDCSLTSTDKRRSPKAFDTIMNIVTK